MAIFLGLIGFAGLIVLAWAISENRRAFPWQPGRWNWSCWHRWDFFPALSSLDHLL